MTPIKSYKQTQRLLNIYILSGEEDAQYSIKMEIQFIRKNC